MSVGLHNKKYHYRNQPYSKEEYENLVTKIIAHMNEVPYIDKKGRIYKYGEFFPTEISQIKWLEDNGFEVPKYKLTSSYKEVIYIWNDYQKSIRASISYEIDGLVCAINDLEFQADLGETNMRAKGKRAFKFPNETGKSKIKNIEFQVGSTGRITPVAILEKVKILGVDITELEESIDNFYSN